MEITKEDQEYLKNELKKNSGISGGSNPHDNIRAVDYTEFKRLEEENHQLKIIESTIKPYVKRYREDGGVLRIDLPISVPEIYNMARLSSILRTVHLNLKNEIFRRGLRWKKRFAVKCEKCGKEFAAKPDVFVCDCGSQQYRHPDSSALINLERFFVHANKNDEPLIDVFKEGEYDLEIVDDLFIILIKEYMILEGKVVGSRIKEIIRGDPEFMRLVGNEKSEMGGKYWVCVRHRNLPLQGKGTTDQHEKLLGRHFDSPGNCPVCGLELQEVVYVAVGGSRSMDPEQYYVRGEVIHRSKYSPSRTYGYPPVLSIWKECSTLLNMQHFVNEYFKYMRSPRGILTTTTTNTECYDKETEVLTDSGWKLFEYLNYEDKVATLSKDGKYLEYQKPNKIMEYEYKGNMVSFESNRASLLVTPNHRMYIKRQEKYQIKFAKDIKGKNILKKDFDWRGKEEKFFVLPDIIEKYGNESNYFVNKEIPMDLWLEFLGYFISEGSCTGNHINICQYKDSNPEKYEKMKKCIEQFSIGWYIDEHGFGVTNKQLSLYLSKIGKSHEKYIPREFMFLSKRQLKILLDALILGDGTNDGNSVQYATTSKKLSDDVYELILKCGFTANVYKRKQKDSIINGKLTHFEGYLYIISISNFLKTSRYMGETEIYESRHKKEVDYEGKVYCCNVPSGLIYVRRNGKSLFCGNSAYKVWDKILENIKRDPHYIPMLAIQDNGTGKRQNQFNWVSFTNTLQEMEYGNVRDELRIRVSALYGVSNVMMGDTKGGGGIGNEGLQIVVSDRAVQWGQEVWNTGVFPELCRQFDIFDYVLELRPNIELVEQKKLELELQRLQIAEGFWRMGFKVELDTDGKFKFSGKAVSMQEMSQQKSQTDINSASDTPESKIISEDHTSGLSTGQNLTGKTPRGSSGVQYA